MSRKSKRTNWIMYEKGTAEKPEVFGISERCGGIDIDAVIGKLLRVWSWFDSNTTNGHAKDVTNVTLKVLLDRQVGVTGFCDAMIAVGWLSEEGGFLSIPDYERHNGETSKSRWQSRLRQAASRSKRDESNDKSVTDVTSEAQQERDTIEIEVDITHTLSIVAEDGIPKPGFPSREDVLAYATRKGWGLQSAAKFWLHHDAKRSEGEPYVPTWHWWSKLEQWVMNDAQVGLIAIRGGGKAAQTGAALPKGTIDDYERSTEWNEDQMKL